MPERMSDTSELELLDYLRVIARRKWIIVIAVVAMVGAAYSMSKAQTPVYEAHTDFVLVEPILTEGERSGRRDSAQGVATEMQVLQSQSVRDKVAAVLGTAPPVTVGLVAESEVIRVRAESTVPKQAAIVANTYVDKYLEVRREQAGNALQKAIQQIQPKINDLQREIDGIDAQINATPLLQRRAKEDQLGPRRDLALSEQGRYRETINRHQLQLEQLPESARVVSPAVIPTRPVKPNPVRNALIALPIGLIFGLALAFLYEYLDDSIKSKDDLDRATGSSLPVLGIIPAWRSRSRSSVISMTEPASPAVEAYRTLRTSVQFLGLDRPLACVQVTSPVTAEGKTTTLANLAVVLARTGTKVIVVDCDLRRPRVHSCFNLANGAGFTSVLLGEAPLSAAIQQVEGQERLSVLTSGPIPPNPSELLASRRTTEVLAALRAQGGIVLLDCPPVVPVTDASVLASSADATLLVAAAGTTTRKQLHRAIELLRQVDAPLVGMVFNRVTLTELEYGYSAEPYAYDRVEDRGRTRRRSGTEEPAATASAQS